MTSDGNMKGRLSVVGFGPGSKDHMTLQAVESISKADVVVGYSKYVELLQQIFPNKNFYSTGMTGEVERCEEAVKLALSGKRVALVSSGDSGIYGMAGIAYQTADSLNADIDIDVVPGVTAASMAASVLGAPLMHDLSIISLSDLMTPIETIMDRVDKAAESDMVICLYNPKSMTRTEYLNAAARIIMKYRKPETPVGIVRNAGRDDERKTITTLSQLHEADVDMFCIVIIGNSCSFVSNNRMITPRGYRI